MKNCLNFAALGCLLFCVSTMVGTSTLLAQGGSGQESPPAEQGSDVVVDQETEAQDAVEQEDPFALPESNDAKDFFEYIETVKAERDRTIKTELKIANAVVDATEAIRGLEGVKSADETKAIIEEVSALRFLGRFQRESQAKLAALIESIKDDDRPEIAKIAVIEGFKMRLGNLRDASAEELQATVQQLYEIVGDGPFDREDYSLANSLARVIPPDEHGEVAAEVYEFMAAKMAESDDEALQERAGKMKGAARRMRLLGEPIEIVCATADGDPLDWDSYRGKVVLVDFWASWCGPCRAEIPNMKRNLQAYSDSFDILGVNLDRTRKAMDSYIDDNELSWTNLMSSEESEMGWENPMANYYGIMGIPTAILVDQKGVVVSLKARGKELDRLLLEMLGEPKQPEADPQEETPTEADDDA